MVLHRKHLMIECGFGACICPVRRLQAFFCENAKRQLFALDSLEGLVVAHKWLLQVHLLAICILE